MENSQIKTIPEMKKLLLIAAFAAACTTMSAQHKGEMNIGGSLGFYGGRSTSSVTVGGSTTSTSTPAGTVLELNPEFGYFLIDNLELSVGLDYSMSREATEITDNRTLFSSVNIATLTLGASYYIPLVEGKLYYTPGVRFGFGGGSRVQQGSNQNDSTRGIPFVFDFRAGLGSVEFRPSARIGISVDILDISVMYYTVDSGYDNIKVSSTLFDAGFNYGLSAGVKYYF